MRFMILSFALGLSVASTIQATVIFNTLGDPDVGNRGVDVSAQYQSFSNSAGAFSLSDVQVNLLRNGVAGTLSVDLYANSSNTPGALLFHIGSVNDSDLPASGSVTKDLPVAPFALTSGARYWIGLSSSNGSQARWTLGLTSAGDSGTTGEFIDDTNSVSSDSVLNFRTLVTTVPAVTAAAPEPGTLALGVVALLALAITRRRVSSVLSQKFIR